MALATKRDAASREKSAPRVSSHTDYRSGILDREYLITPRLTKKELDLLNLIKMFRWRCVRALPVSDKENKYVKSLPMESGWPVDVRQHIAIHTCILGSSLGSPIRWFVRRCGMSLTGTHFR